MPNHHFERTGLNQPCVKDCPDRKAGCAINCEKWAAYLKEREAMYEERRKQVRAGQYSRGRIERKDRYNYRSKTK